MVRSTRSRIAATLAIAAIATTTASCSLWPQQGCAGEDCSGSETILQATVSQSGKLPDPEMPVTVTDPTELGELQSVLDEHDVWQQDVELLGMCTDVTITTIAYTTDAGTFELAADGCVESALADDALAAVADWTDAP